MQKIKNVVINRIFFAALSNCRTVYTKHTKYTKYKKYKKYKNTKIQKYTKYTKYTKYKKNLNIYSRKNPSITPHTSSHTLSFKIPSYSTNKASLYNLSYRIQ